MKNTIIVITMFMCIGCGKPNKENPVATPEAKSGQVIQSTQLNNEVLEQNFNPILHLGDSATEEPKATQGDTVIFQNLIKINPKDEWRLDFSAFEMGPRVVQAFYSFDEVNVDRSKVSDQLRRPLSLDDSNRWVLLLRDLRSFTYNGWFLPTSLYWINLDLQFETGETRRYKVAFRLDSDPVFSFEPVELLLGNNGIAGLSNELKSGRVPLLKLRVSNVSKADAVLFVPKVKSDNEIEIKTYIQEEFLKITDSDQFSDDYQRRFFYSKGAISIQSVEFKVGTEGIRLLESNEEGQKILIPASSTIELYWFGLVDPKANACRIPETAIKDGGRLGNYRDDYDLLGYEANGNINLLFQAMNDHREKTDKSTFLVKSVKVQQVIGQTAFLKLNPYSCQGIFR